jgi:uncharacterized repeat protein (TIGR03803 family)
MDDPKCKALKDEMAAQLEPQIVAPERLFDGNDDLVSRSRAGRFWRLCRWGAVSLGLVAVTAAQAQWRLEFIAVGSRGGEQPFAKVTEGPDGMLYGTTRLGGLYNGGTLFRVGKDGREFRMLHVFGPAPDGIGPTYGRLIFGTNGWLYGVAGLGGSSGYGTVFRLQPDGAGYQTLYHANSGPDSARTPRGRLWVGDDGSLYGSGQEGVIFKIDHDGSNYQVVNRARDNPGPVGTLYQSGVIKGTDGWLYGTTENGGLTNPVVEFGSPTMGTIFRLQQDGTHYEILYQFKGPTVGGGFAPRAALCEASDGKLYGVCSQGGNSSFGGTAYRINRDGSGFEEIHRFSPSGSLPHQAPFGDLIEGSDGAIYGQVSEGVFRMNKDGSDFATIAVVTSDSFSGLTQASDGRLYGTRFDGLYAVNKDGSGFGWLVRFGGSSVSASNSRAPLLLTSTGSLLGTTEAGASGNGGAVFLIETNSSVIRVVAEPGSTIPAGKQPNGLAEGTDGFLYGTTQSGGSNNLGVIFRIDGLLGRDLTNLYHFGGPGDGRVPRVALVSGRDGFLYGVGYLGGMFGRGTIFKIGEGGTGYATLYHFGATNPDGQGVLASLLVGPDGWLYGVANGGGSASRGTVFRLNRDGTGYANLRHFAGGSDGANPQSPLLLGSDGYLYGNTTSGGNGFGTIYRLKPDGSDYRLLYAPTNALQGSGLRGPMIEKPRGLLWGCAPRGGTNNSGVVFRALMDGTDYRVAWIFAGGSGGLVPSGGLTLDRAGWAAGTTAEGGAAGFGTVFRFDPSVVYLRHEIAGENFIVRWEPGPGVDDVETATEWSAGQPLWQSHAAEIEPDGPMSRAVFPLRAVGQILIRVRRDP